MYVAKENKLQATEHGRYAVGAQSSNHRSPRRTSASLFIVSNICLLFIQCLYVCRAHSLDIFFHRLRRVLHWNESRRPSQSNMPHKARVISGTFLRCAHTCLQTFRGRMVTRAEATPATHHPHFHEGVSQKVLKSRFL